MTRNDKHILSVPHLQPQNASRESRNQSLFDALFSVLIPPIYTVGAFTAAFPRAAALADAVIRSKESVERVQKLESRRIAHTKRPTGIIHRFEAPDKCTKRTSGAPGVLSPLLLTTQLGRDALYLELQKASRQLRIILLFDAIF